ncbi:hypothetical protein DL93DRAFT_2091465, partial [Clavulina sp. PMI_390]
MTDSITENKTPNRDKSPGHPQNMAHLISDTRDLVLQNRGPEYLAQPQAGPGPSSHHSNSMVIEANNHVAYRAALLTRFGVSQEQDLSNLHTDEAAKLLDQIYTVCACL